MIKYKTKSRVEKRLVIKSLVIILLLLQNPPPGIFDHFDKTAWVESFFVVVFVVQEGNIYPTSSSAAGRGAKKRHKKPRHI